MEAIILAGGFGTRLKHIVTDVPKPMASVCGKPFLVYIVDYLLANGITKIVMAVGYKSDIIIDFFGNSYCGVEITYSVENTPLFTGGAIKKALSYCSCKQVFVINGDTFFDVNLKAMRQFHDKDHAVLTIAVKEMFEFERYGTVEINDNRIVNFSEKKYVKQGYINGGIYCMNRDILDCIQIAKFSYEIDVMAKKVHDIPMFAYMSDGYFIDIGIPEDYFRAQNDFKDRV